jgi:predicted amidohydrolase YtcJ
MAMFINRFINQTGNAFLLLSVFLFTGAVQGQGRGNIPPQLISWADTILIYGKIVSMDDDRLNTNLGTIAEAMAVRDGKVLALGSNAEIQALAGPNTDRIDLKGRTIVPGIIDTHSHMFEYADDRSRPRPANLTPTQGGWDLLEGPFETWNEIIDTIISEVTRRAASQPPGTRIYLRVPRSESGGYLWEGERHFLSPFVQRVIGLSLEEGTVLTEAELRAKPISRAKLDELAPDHVVHINLGFNGIGNTKVMELAKSLTYGPFMDPGIIGTEQTGLTFNSFNRIMTGEVFNPFMNQVKWYRQEGQLTAAMGITTFSSNVRSMTQVAAYRYLEANGELYNLFGYGPSAGTAPQVLPAVLAEMGAGFNPTELRFGTEFMWYVGTGSRAADSSYPGILSSLEPPQIPQRIKDRESMVHMVEAMMGNIDYYVTRGNRFTNTHIAGDAALDMVLETIEKSSAEGGISLERIRAKRHVIDHCTMNPRPDQIEQLRYYNMIASCAPKYIANVNRIAEDYGEQYVNWIVPMRSLIDAGVTAVLEIDEAITRGLFWYLDMMVTRRDLNGRVWAPQEAIDRNEAIKASTIWATEYVGRKNDLGSLQPGKLADYLILNKDYFSVPDNMIRTVRPLMTVVNGRPVYIDEGYAAELAKDPVGMTPTFVLEHIAIWEAEAGASVN